MRWRGDYSPMISPIDDRLKTILPAINHSSSGPFVQVVGCFDLYQEIPLTVHIPLSTAHMFLDADTTLAYFEKAAIARHEKFCKNSSSPEFVKEKRAQALQFVEVMKGFLAEVRNGNDKQDVWVALVSSELQFSNNIVLVHPCNNDKVKKWMDGGPIKELAEMIGLSPLFRSDVELVAAENHFNGEKGDNE